MIQDTQTTFSGTISAAGARTGQSITATAISEHVLDRAGGLAAFPTLEDEGVTGPKAYLVVQALTAAAGGDAAKTLTITLESDTAVGLGTANVVHAASAAITGAQITAGATLFRIPLPLADYKRYLGLRYTVSVGFTAFQVAAFLVVDGVQRNVIYPSGFTVDA